jgi:hypothetical protein
MDLRASVCNMEKGKFCPQKLALTLPTSGGCSVGIVHSRTRPRSLVLILYTVHRIPWAGNQTIARLLLIHRATQIQSKRRHPCLRCSLNTKCAQK